MTLIEAYLRYAVLPDDADGDAIQRMEEAAAVLQAQLERLGRRLTFGGDIVAEAIGDLCVALLEHGDPRGRAAPDEPQTDSEARARLYSMLRNKCIDMYRKEKRTVALDDVVRLSPLKFADPASALVPDCSLEGRRQELARYAASLSAGEQDGIRIMLRIADGEATFDALLEADLREERDGQYTLTRARNRRYTQFKRALGALRRAIEDDAEASLWDKAGLLGAAEELRLRPPTAPRIRSRRRQRK